MTDKLLDYFMQETNRRFEELSISLRNDIGEMKEILSDLTKFKVEMMVTARITSLVVSAACGLATMVVTLLVTHYWGAK